MTTTTPMFTKINVIVVFRSVIIMSGAIYMLSLFSVVDILSITGG